MLCDTVMHSHGTVGTCNVTIWNCYAAIWHSDITIGHCHTLGYCDETIVHC